VPTRAARTKRSIDLNADVGEATDEPGIATERALMSLVTTANVACGGHAGDEASMTATVAAAVEHGVQVGAHPSYPDREGFGRNPMDIDRMALRASLVDQLGALEEVCRAAGAPMGSVKAHGAMYEEVAKGGAIYQVLRDAMHGVCAPDTVLVLPSGCAAMAAVLRDGVPAREEGFCDRAYRHDGGLVDRGEPGAVFTEPAAGAEQAVSLARGAVVAADGSILTLWVDTLCIHGDSPGAVALATAVRAALEAIPIEVAAPITSA
jgi:5-oxoprolinase (ATP-hydrolysing) subunit A